MRLAALASLSLIASASGEYVSMFVERVTFQHSPEHTTYQSMPLLTILATR